tara:strand:- start:440 stop:838 length:399 start_codon:yes stop_codon:yes gene_type:complete
MDKFKLEVFNTDSGIRKLYICDNGWMLSAILNPTKKFIDIEWDERGGYTIEDEPNKTCHSYGGDGGLWEVALIGPTGDIRYDTPVTDDVLGHLTDDEVLDLADIVSGWETEIIITTKYVGRTWKRHALPDSL